MKSYKKMVLSDKETTRELYDAIKGGTSDVANIVEAGNMKPVTSDAVAKALNSFVDKTSKVTIKVVNDATAELISNATVTLGTTTQETGNDGQAIFNDVKYGNYLLTVSKEGFSEHSESIIIGDETYVNTIQLIPENTGNVIFYVRTVDGEPAQADIEMDNVVKSTDEDGNCTFENLKYGEYNYTASNDSYETQTGTITLNQDEVEVSLVMTAKKVSNVIFKVTAASGGTAISDATVQFGNYSGTTGLYGTCTFKNVAIGEYNYTISKTGYNTISGMVQVNTDNYSFKFSLETANTLAGGNSTGIVPISNNHPVLTVKHKNKDKATRYPIEIINASNNSSVAKGKTNKRGEFKFTVEPNVERLICKVIMDNKSIESYELGNSNETGFNIVIPDEDRCALNIQVEYGEGLYYSLVQVGNREESTGEDKSCLFEDVKYGTYDLTISTKYFHDYTDTITINSTKQEYKAVLKPKLSDITVTVKDEFTETPIENATIKINKESKTTDKDGKAEFKLMRQGLLSIQGKHDNYESNHEIFNISDEKEKVNLKLSHKLTTAKFNIVNKESKKPIQYAYIKLGDNIGESDKNGKYTFNKLAYGNYYLNVSAVNYDEYLGDIDIKSEAQEINIELPPKKTENNKNEKSDDKKESENKK